MHACPTCVEYTIGWWAKAHASSTLPTRCKQCGGLSHIEDWVGSASSLFSEIWFWGCIALAAYLQSWWPILAIPIEYSIWIVGIGLKANLIPINEPKLANNRRKALWFVMAVIACAIAVYLIFGPDTPY